MALEDIVLRQDERARFRLPPLGSQMDGFCAWLSRQGFSQGAMRRRVCQASLPRPQNNPCSSPPRVAGCITPTSISLSGKF